MTVRELLSRMDSAELSEWMAYDRLEPLEDGYWQAALICSTLANLMGDGRKHFKPDDFMPRRAEPRKPQTPEQMKAVFEAVIAGVAAKQKQTQKRKVR